MVRPPTFRFLLLIYRYTKDDHDYALWTAKGRRDWIIKRGYSTRWGNNKRSFFDNYMGTLGERSFREVFLIPYQIQFEETEPWHEATKTITHDFIVNGQRIGVKTMPLTDDNPRERQSYYVYPAKCLPEVACRHQNGYPDLLVQAGLYRSRREVQLRGWIYREEIENVKEIIELQGEMAHKIPRKLYKPMSSLRQILEWDYLL